MSGSPYRTPATPSPVSPEERAREQEERERAEGERELLLAEAMDRARKARFALIAERREIFLRDVKNLLAPRYGDPRELQRRVLRWVDVFDAYGEESARAALGI